MRRENRKQRQKKRQKSAFFLAVTFVLVACLTFFAMSFFNQEKKNETAVLESSDIKISSQTIETKDETVATTNTTEQLVIETSDDTEKEVLDDSGLLANAAQVSYGVYYFNNDTYISNNNNAPMVSASVIKVFIMSYIYEKGIGLQVTSAGESLSSLTQRMIQSSDNHATNTIIDYLGMDVLNQYFEESGYFDTQIQRKMLDEQARSLGKENYTSLNDTMSFLKKIYQNKDSAPYSLMLEVMAGQQIRTKIPRKLPANIVVANKTGELPAVENDIGLVLSVPDPFAIVVLSNNVSSSEGMRDAIGNFALNALRE
ncbi:serine hydrolase [Vagococcus elongatus]|nr:serine hydrolase [Vagococcus elongatus]